MNNLTHHGLILENYRGQFVVDGFYENYTFVEKGDYNFSAGYNYISIPNTSRKIIYAIQPPTNTYIVPWGYKKVGNQITHIRVFSEGSGSGKYILFENMPEELPPIGSRGLFVYNTNGDIVFSSLHKYMKIIGRYMVSRPSIGEITEKTIKSSNNYFLISPLAYYGNLEINGYSYVMNEYTVGFKLKDSTTIQTKLIIFKTSTGSSNLGGDGSGTISRSASTRVLEIQDIN